MQKMSEKEAIEIHIAENIHKIEVIENFMYRVPDADKEKCRKNISVLSKINGLLEEIQQYRAIGTVDQCHDAVERMKASCETCRDKVGCAIYDCFNIKCCSDWSE